MQAYALEVFARMLDINSTCNIAIALHYFLGKHVETESMLDCRHI